MPEGAINPREIQSIKSLFKLGVRPSLINQEQLMKNPIYIFLL
ncbi:MAG: hypothetical protein CM15mP87_11120 [Candidatus Neomarinimicrobiota bacterium]|nr:MAG: hypothetical protein CM15mP87_11120 [Candidatus Neomarinimicrobiota bacterium]